MDQERHPDPDTAFAAVRENLERTPSRPSASYQYNLNQSDFLMLSFHDWTEERSFTVSLTPDGVRDLRATLDRYLYAWERHHRHRIS